MSDSLKINIRTRAEGDPAGFDSAIISVPARWYVTVDGKRAFLANLAGRDLRVISEQMAADINEKLHSAVWTITSDPAEVRTLGMMHDCATCRAGVVQALAVLRDHPDREVAVGQLWWAEQ